MNIRTLSHIDQAHADGPYFPLAESEDGRFRWQFGSPDSVRLLDGTCLDCRALSPTIAPAVVREAREFLAAVHATQEQRQRVAERWDESEESETRLPLCRMCSTVCDGDCQH